MSEARRNRRSINRTAKKVLGHLDIVDEYIKLSLGISKLKQSDRQLLAKYVATRRAQDKNFDDLINKLMKDISAKITQPKSETCNE